MPNTSDFFSIPGLQKGTRAENPLVSVLLAAVFAAVLFVLAITGYSLVTESGISSQPQLPFIESSPKRGAVPPVPEDSMPPSDEGVACTMDAKICPDGSAVGRMPPSCEFAPCP